MKRTLLLTCIIAVLCVSFYAVAWGQNSKPAATQAPSATAAAAAIDPKLQAEFSAKADMFLQLLAYGEAAQDPVVLLGAVKVLDDLPFASVSTTDEKGLEVKRFDRDTILKKAKEFAAGDAELEVVITKIQDAPVKTAVRGQGGRDRNGRYDGRTSDPRYNGGHSYYERPIHDRRYEQRLERRWDRERRRWVWRERR